MPAPRVAAKLEAERTGGFNPRTQPTESIRASAPVPHFSFTPRILSVASLAALLVVTGCKPLGPNYNRPVFTAPPAYKETGATAVVVPPPNPADG